MNKTEPGPLRAAARPAIGDALIVFITCLVAHFFHPPWPVRDAWMLAIGYGAGLFAALYRQEKRNRA